MLYSYTAVIQSDVEEILLGTSAINPPWPFQRQAHLGLIRHSHLGSFIIVVGTGLGR